MTAISRLRAFALGLLLVASPALADPVGRVVAGTAATSSLIVKAGTVILPGVNVVSGASAGYLMVFDSAAVPADGAVTPKKCIPVAANTGVDLNWRASPLYFQNGAVLVFSTTGCFTKTASATAFLSGDIQ